MARGRWRFPTIVAAVEASTLLGTKVYDPRAGAEFDFLIFNQEKSNPESLSHGQHMYEPARRPSRTNASLPEATPTFASRYT